MQILPHGRHNLMKKHAEHTRAADGMRYVLYDVLFGRYYVPRDPFQAIVHLGNDEAMWKKSCTQCPGSKHCRRCLAMWCPSNPSGRSSDRGENVHRSGARWSMALWFSIAAAQRVRDGHC
jgi:hypothetical protein